MTIAATVIPSLQEEAQGGLVSLASAIEAVEAAEAIGHARARGELDTEWRQFTLMRDRCQRAHAEFLFEYSKAIAEVAHRTWLSMQSFGRPDIHIVPPYPVAESAVREALAAQPRSEVDELVAEIKIRALNAASLPRDPEPRRMQLEALNACVDRLAALSASQPAQAAVIECDCETAISPDGSRITTCGSDQMRRAVEQGHAFFKASAQAAVAVPAPAGLTDEQIATMRSDAWLVFNASEASQEVRDVIEWYDGTLYEWLKCRPSAGDVLTDEQIKRGSLAYYTAIVSGNADRAADEFRRAALTQEGSTK